MKLRDFLERLDMEGVDPEATVLIRDPDRPGQYLEVGIDICEVEWHPAVDVWVEHDPGDEPNPGFDVLPAVVIG